MCVNVNVNVCVCVCVCVCVHLCGIKYYTVFTYVAMYVCIVIFYCIKVLCTESDIHLVDGDDGYEGHVEMCHNGVWGTVCGVHGNAGMVACC